jgi:ribosomal protein S18 acetylase RimI-like enzyme
MTIFANNTQINLCFEKSMTLKLVSASNFDLDQLTTAYNSARADYLVSMPMKPSGLADYIQIYDIDLSQSLVALDEGQLVGLGMLGIRNNKSWITRLGLRAKARTKGIGQAIVKGLLENSDRLAIPLNMLEVIKGNQPARLLFLKLGFIEMRELVILERPAKLGAPPQGSCIQMDQREIMILLNQRSNSHAWTNQTESIKKVKNLFGFHVVQNHERIGWIIYQITERKISRLVFKTIKGDPVKIMYSLLAHLHFRHPKHTVYTENIPSEDPRLPAFIQHGYREVFQRLELHRISSRL